VTTFLLIRHGLTDAVGKTITGRLPDVHLNDSGRKQAVELLARLGGWKIDAICSSPLERALETADQLAKRLRLKVAIFDALNEVDFGAWSGMTIEQLNQFPEWRLYNTFRSSTRAPGGELATEVQTRMVAMLTGLSRQHPEQTMALFSHADPIRLALVHFLGMPIDLMHRLEIRPASLSVVRLAEWGPQVVLLNSL